MTGVGAGRAEHQRRHGQQPDEATGTGNGQQGTGEDGQQGDRATPVATLRKRARRGDTTAAAELAGRGITFRRGSVTGGRELHAQRHPRPDDDQ